ncbi:hypothetical protein [Alteromonas sp. RKMC-009]|uniref:hypothetical protein n=1 Tax=Alteromonas sp. RKMC-009 TaxID=2267264 RepID=UPI000E67DF3C|nr:hypothetical protein [Alteromonas sp. RKMC-009]AYA64312.1 hypothetical protein DS731_10055 [Alteromonas sp. RKMC-009]
MKLYAAYSKAVQTDQRDALIEAYPHAAVYGEHYLFPCSYEQLTGETNPNTVDLTGKRLVEEIETEHDMTFAEFDALCDQMLADETGREVLLSVQQGRYLKETRFTTEEQTDVA